MREIKFRAWDKARNQWADRLRWGTGIYKDGTCYVGGSDNLELCLFTGLKDKNGKEIYEADIVKYTDSEGISYEAPVQYITEEWSTCGFILSNGIRLIGRYMERYEVIGNIYENPELLEVK